MVFRIATALTAIGLTMVQELVHSCSLVLDPARDPIDLSVASMALCEGFGASSCVPIARKHWI